MVFVIETMIDSMRLQLVKEKCGFSVVTIYLVEWVFGEKI